MLRTKLAPRIMAATFGLTCLLAAATSHARVLVSGVGVHCWHQNEVGEDEIFMKFNGARINMGNFSDGVGRTSSNTVIVSSLPVTAQLWESDGDHWYDGDDLWQSMSCPDFGTSCHNQSLEDGFQYHQYYWWATLSFVP